MDRSASPASTFLLPTAPLNIRKTSQPQQANGNGVQTSSSSNPSASFLSPHPPANRGHSAPSLSLKIPILGQPKPGKPKLKISGFTNGGSDGFDDSLSIDGAFCGGYYGGAAFQPTSLSMDGPDDVTIRPNSAETQTMDDLRATIRKLDIGPTPQPKLSSLSSTSIHQVLSNGSQGDEWSDEFLQELDRLGEGAGGAVHKVRDKRTDVVMARKTITTREAPLKQLNRELSFMSSTSHPNIIKFYAAYISPSSSEIKLLMEFCEGGSLEAVGKRIREKGWRVGEKVAGRLAEGVSLGFRLTPPFPSRNPLC
jgi:mitogen-activated protein kinase kinase